MSWHYEIILNVTEPTNTFEVTHSINLVTGEMVLWLRSQDVCVLVDLQVKVF